MIVFQWLPATFALVLLVVPVLLRPLSPRRDVFLLVGVIQPGVFLDVAPTIHMSDLSEEMANRYATFLWLLLPLFQAPLLAVYRWRRPVADGRPTPRFDLSVARAAFLMAATLAL